MQIVPNLTVSVHPFESGTQPATSCLINSTAHKTQRQSQSGHRQLGKCTAAAVVLVGMNHQESERGACKRETSSVPQIRVHYISCSQVSTLIKCVRAPMSWPLYIHIAEAKIHAWGDNTQRRVGWWSVCVHYGDSCDIWALIPSSVQQHHWRLSLPPWLVCAPLDVRTDTAGPCLCVREGCCAASAGPGAAP